MPERDNGPVQRLNLSHKTLISRVWTVSQLKSNGLTSVIETLSAAVAFHHAGLDPSDRHVVEKGFLEGQVNVICCTSTLAVGVNLPCHMVIIKNTVCFQEEGLKEYADLEIIQMLGRAGRYGRNVWGSIQS